MNCKQINQIPLTQVLDNLGIKPTKQRNKDVWFFSPFREEKTASFKINLANNKFHDFGNGSKGTVVDFWCEYKCCNVKTAIKEISNIFSFPEQVNIPRARIIGKNVKQSKPHFKILESKPLSINSLKGYLSQRGLSHKVYSYIMEVDYENNGRKYFAVGFKNDLDGYELRSLYFKGCSSKTITSLIKDDSSTLILFEGFIDFLTYIERTEANEANESFIILNSLAMIQKAKPYFSKYDKVKLFLDNDQAGLGVAEELISEFSNIIDKSSTYSSFKDYNDFHVNSLMKI